MNVFYAGGRVNNWSEGLWPHSWCLQSPYEVGGGKKFYDYQITNMGSKLTLGTFCHENGHMICDFPDLYDYGYQSAGIGDYCLMCYGGDDYNPSQVNAYLKYKAGWASQVTPITRGMQASISAGRNEFFIHQRNDKEYFLIENRRKAGRDASLPDEGLAIWHVDETGSNENEQMTVRQHYECSLEQADAQYDLEHNVNGGDAGDLFGSPENNSFTSETTPSSHWWDGSDSQLEITDISSPGPVMRFKTPTAETRLGIIACNNMFICAENGGDSPLIANRTWVKAWETFVLTDLGDGKVALRATNGKYVAAENGGDLPLIANRDWIRSWETFEYIDLGNQEFALKACNGKYVCAEHNGTDALIANRSNIGTWETFRRYEVLSIGFKACNNKYVCAENNGSAPLIANRIDHREWETYTLVSLGAGFVALKACNGKFVCAENAGALPLIANRDQARAWETFEYIDLGSDKFALKACNGKYVCAEHNGIDALIANRSNIGSWETFVLG